MSRLHGGPDQVGFPIETLQTSRYRPDSLDRGPCDASSPGPLQASGRSDPSGREPRADRPRRLQSFARWIAVAGGLGYVPRAPGTAGSVAGLLLFLAAVYGASLSLSSSSPGSSISAGGLGVAYALGVVVLFAVGVWAAGRAEIDFGRSDDGRIVIDEVVGQLIALAPLLPIASGRVSGGHLFFGVVTGFVLFRLFDIGKPGVIRWAERRFEGGFGVMADDVLAGIHAAVCLFVIQAGVVSLWPDVLQPDALGLEALPADSLVLERFESRAWA